MWTRRAHLLQPVDLLLEVDIERLAHAAQRLDAHLDVVRLVVGRQLGLHRVGVRGRVRVRVRVWVRVRVRVLLGLV